MSLLVAILGCVPHTPPPVYAEHVKAVELSPIEKVEPVEDECLTHVAVGPGDQVSCVGVLVPPGDLLVLGAKIDRGERYESLYRGEVDSHNRTIDQANKDVGECQVAFVEQKRATTYEKVKNDITGLVVVVALILAAVAL